MEKKRTNILIISGLVLVSMSILSALGKFQEDRTKLINYAYRFFEEPNDEVEIPEIIKAVIENPTEFVLKKEFTNQINYSSYFLSVPTRNELSNPEIPAEIEIPSIGLYAPVISADYNFTDVEGETFGQWKAPSEFAAGWHPDSALLGKKGNTVINGHHNAFGEVFKNLLNVKEGDLIYIYSNNNRYTFIVANKMILPERFMDAATRLENAKWLSKSGDIRLTLVTCWPAYSNSHRLILVARPLD